MNVVSFVDLFVEFFEWIDDVWIVSGDATAQLRRTDVAAFPQTL